ncbi:MAG: hypothetical protein KDI98_07895 [Hyphomicrobiaceae bacterium]|nr:hypothetical protein [Hyphomicrobiaceae bacterium]
MPEFFIEDLSDRIADTVQHPALRTLYRLWMDKAGAGVPQLSALSPLSAEIEAATLLLVLFGDELVYVRYGRNLTTSFGEDYSGRTTSSVPGDPGRFFDHFYREVLEGDRARLTVNQATLAPRIHIWERLCLPVRLAEGRGLMVGVAPRAFQSELVDAILDANVDGIFALGAITDEFGSLADARIIFANAAAGALCGRAREDMVSAHIADIFPDVFENGVFALIQQSARDATPLRFDIASPAGLNRGYYRVTIAPWKSGVTLTWCNISDLAAKKPELPAGLIANLTILKPAS